MNFNYYSLNTNLLEKIEISNETIYILGTNSDKALFSKSFEPSLFKENPLFWTFDELKEKVFLSDKFLLKDEKRTLLLYSSLTEEIKNKLNFRTYSDFIDYGENFLKFYKELKTYKIKDLGNLQLWQKESFEIMEEIFPKFESLLANYNYTIPEFIIDMENFDDGFLKGYKNISFVGLFNFVPVEKDLLNKLAQNYNLDFHLKMDKNSFDEENLQFLSLELETTLSSKIEVYEVRDTFETMVNLVNDLNINPNFVVYSCDFQGNNYNNLISANFLQKKCKTKFEESKLYQILELFSQIIEVKEIINGKNLYKIHEIVNALENKDFRTYFGISKTQKFWFLENFLKAEFKYINFEVIQINSKNYTDLEAFEKFFRFFEELFENKDLNSFTEYLSNPSKFNYKHFAEEKYTDLFAKYFEGLSEVKSNEMLEFKYDWTKIFDKNKLSESLFKLILKYLKKKDLEEAKLKESKSNLADFDIKNLFLDNQGIIIDISNNTYPKKAKAQFLLNDIQRKKLFMPNSSIEKELSRYNFFNKISSMEAVKIYSFKNSDLNIDSSGFVDELCLKYGIKITPLNYSSKDLSAFVKDFFAKDKTIETLALSKDNLSKNNKDFGERYFLGAYDYNTMKECPYQFYLKNISKLDVYDRNILYDFENRTMGIIVHSLFERVFHYYRESIKNGIFELSIQKVNEIFNEITNENIYKIPVELKIYFKEIIMPLYTDSVISFFNELEKKLSNQEITSFLEEKSTEKELFKTDLTMGIKGRADLIVEGAQNYIFDVKTGGSNSSQLSFYEILYYDEGNTAQKYIYNAWKNELKEDKTIFSKDQLIGDIKEFLSKENYTRAEKVATCRYCNYTNICRMRWENEQNCTES